MAEPKDIAILTAKLSAAYPNWNLTEFTNDVYYEDLCDLPAEVLFAAAQHCRTSVTRDQRFAPSAGEIRVAAFELKRQADGVPSALDAWAELLKAPKSEEFVRQTDERDETTGAIIIERIPYKWSHPLVRKVAVAMGFPKFPDWEQESFERTAFLKAYQAELNRFITIEAQPEDVKRFVDRHANRPQLETVATLALQMGGG